MDVQDLLTIFALNLVTTLIGIAMVSEYNTSFMITLTPWISLFVVIMVIILAIMGIPRR